MPITKKNGSVAASSAPRSALSRPGEVAREADDENDHHAPGEDRRQANEELAAAEGERRGDEPRDERRMVEVADVEMLRIVPVVGLLRREFDLSEVDEAQDEQVGDREQRRDPGASRRRTLARTRRGRAATSAPPRAPRARWRSAGKLARRAAKARPRAAERQARPPRRAWPAAAARQRRATRRSRPRSRVRKRPPARTRAALPPRAAARTRRRRPPRPRQRHSASGGRVPGPRGRTWRATSCQPTLQVRPTWQKARGHALGADGGTPARAAGSGWSG